MRLYHPSTCTGVQEVMKLIIVPKQSGAESMPRMTRCSCNNGWVCEDHSRVRQRPGLSFFGYSLPSKEKKKNRQSEKLHSLPRRKK